MIANWKMLTPDDMNYLQRMNSAFGAAISAPVEEPLPPMPKRQLSQDEPEDDDGLFVALLDEHAYATRLEGALNVARQDLEDHKKNHRHFVDAYNATFGELARAERKASRARRCVIGSFFVGAGFIATMWVVVTFGGFFLAVRP